MVRGWVGFEPYAEWIRLPQPFFWRRALRALLSIPNGKAWVLTEEEAGIRAVSIRLMVKKMKKMGKLPDTYETTQRTVKGKVSVYIINSSDNTA